MDSKHKKVLNKYRVRLLQHLKISSSFISYLQAVEIMSRAMKEDIEIEQKRSKKAALFLDLLERRGERAFDEFYNALIHTDQAELADLLKPGVAIERRAIQQQRVEEKSAQLAAMSYQLQLNPAVVDQYQSSQSSQYQSSQNPKGQSQPNDIVVISNMNSMRGQPLGTSSDDGNCISITSLVESNQSSCPIENDERPLDEWPADDWAPVTEIDKMRTSPDDWKTRISGGNKYYTMMKRGRAIIINNAKFNGKMGNRPDSKEDVKNLTHLFSHLGYTVSPTKKWQNLTAENMRSQLRKESRHNDHQDVSSFVCVILSHGNNGLIYDVDGAIITIEEIKTMFNSKNSPHLAGKPKIFIIQTCKLTANGMDNESSIESNLSSMPSMSFDINDGDRKGLQGPNDVKEECDSVQVPDDSDMIVVSSTTEGTDSFSSGRKGSWFIQAVVYVFVKHAHNTEIRELFTKVNQLMLKEGTKQARKQHASDTPKLTSQIDHTLQKDLYLYPGLNSD
ncbi:unnamed protein product [Owenia fusiformis]|uniref:Uncharacterized protein n=1 Tax=Owenia fusiformis TaxID=6347 RepID=A0A8S4N085_OWEFU|nr:unnamed protein product [Owenia fusiformis]